MKNYRCNLFLLGVIISVILVFFAGSNVAAQSRLISEYDEVVREANAEIDASMATGFLHKMAEKYNIKNGEFTFNVSIHEKGKVVSISTVKSNSDDVKKQNLVKDIIKQMTFDFKMPKGNIYKFEHTFIFN